MFSPQKTLSLLHEPHENVLVINLGHHCIISKHSAMNNDGQTDGWTDGWTDEQMDGRMVAGIHEANIELKERT